MKHTVNYRRLLDKAVKLFLEQTPSAQTRALRIIRRCLHTEKSFSLDSIVWGGMFAMLSDPVYYDNFSYLRSLRDMLAGISLTRERTYVNYDFREELTPNETRWLEQAQALLVFLGGFPFTQATAAIQTYRRMVESLMAISDSEDDISWWGMETIYHMVLREVTEIVAHIDLELSLQHFGYLVPQTPYSTISEESNYPSVAETLFWAQKALDAITGKNWLLVTWQITPEQVHLSLH